LRNFSEYDLNNPSEDTNTTFSDSKIQSKFEKFVHNEFNEIKTIVVQNPIHVDIKTNKSEIRHSIAMKYIFESSNNDNNSINNNNNEDLD
jgi:hypothetical protein